MAEVPGAQRVLEGDGHLLLILHKLPTSSRRIRELRLFWRNSAGEWSASELGKGIKALQQHVAEFNEHLLKLEDAERAAASAEEYYQIQRAISPIHRTGKHMAATLARAHELVPEDQGLLACRNLAATVERASELLKEDATHGLQYAMAKHAESQALAGHRLNLVAAIFFPIMAFAAIFGMNITHGLEELGRPWLFWALLVLGIFLGFVMRSIVFGIKLELPIHARKYRQRIDAARPKRKA
jgi:Mg2+ and Co2+ transporter CorA